MWFFCSFSISRCFASTRSTSSAGEEQSGSSLVRNPLKLFTRAKDKEAKEDKEANADAEKPPEKSVDVESLTE